jgi:spore maturation protein SpmA
MLNKIWAAFFLIGFVAAAGKWIATGDGSVWAAMVAASFDMAKTAFEIALGLTGMMCLWLGIMKLGEQGGAIEILARLAGPLLRRLFPGVPQDHPAMGAMVMNMSANMLGLDNAGTPLGLKAMKELQTLNPEPDRATDAQVLFLVINTASITLIPVAIFTYRAQMGAADPTDVFLPLLIASFFATLAGLLVTSFFQPIGLRDPVVLAYLGGMSLAIGGLAWYFGSLDKSELERQSSIFSNLLIFSVIVGFLALALRKRVPVYETFVAGAKEGFGVAVGIVPYLVAMLVAIGVLRASGALDLVLDGARWAVAATGLDARWVDALPTGLMRSLSASGSRGLMIETMKTEGADSFLGRLVSIVQGSSETTFYVLAVYFGSVGIRKERHALACGLLADLAGFVAAVLVCYLFFA